MKTHSLAISHAAQGARPLDGAPLVRHLSSRLLWALLCAWAVGAGCSQQAPPLSYPDPTLGAGVEQAAITVQLLSPSLEGGVVAPHPELVLAVGGDADVDRIGVTVQGGAAAAAVRGADGLWRLRVGLLPGDNAVKVRATATNGATYQRGWSLRYTGEAPGVRVLLPVAGGAVQSAGFQVIGEARASGEATIAAVELAPLQGSWQAAKRSVKGPITRFEGALNPAGAAGFRVRARDSAGRVTEWTAPVRLDDVSPKIAITAPTDGTSVGAGLLKVQGVASDDDVVQRVEVRVGDGAWITAQGRSTWQLDLALQQGLNVVQARAVDAAGNVAQAQVTARKRRVVTLLARELQGAGAPLKLTLTKAQLKALLPEAKARDLVIYYMDLRPVIVEALQAVKEPLKYGVDTTEWGQAEKNMQKIVTMKPDNTDFSGTSFDDLSVFSNAFGIALPLFEASIAGIQPTDTYLTTKEVADAMYRTVLSSHPALKVDPLDDIKKLPVTMWDALTDLVDLAETLGPVGKHPGILYKAKPSMVLLPNFAMTVTGETNLRQLEGIDLGEGKSWLLWKKPGAPVVKFDFLDDNKFSAVGVASEPEIDLYFTIAEHPKWVASGKTKGSNPVDGFPKGDGPAWSLPPWTIERLVTDATYHAYRDRHAPAYFKQWSYDVGTIAGASKVTWDKGWLTIKSVAGIGNPPPPGYWWDMVCELAQTRLHDGGLQEGQANLRLAVTGITVPITAKQVLDRSRQLFEEQKDKVASASLGDHQSYDTPLDVALVRRGDEMSLWFIAAADTPGASTEHAKRGLFADAALTNKLSSKADDGSGDTSHEKLAVGDEKMELFAQDRDGSVWRLHVQALSGGRARVEIEPAGAKP